MLHLHSISIFTYSTTNYLFCRLCNYNKKQRHMTLLFVMLDFYAVYVLLVGTGFVPTLDPDNVRAAALAADSANLCAALCARAAARVA